MRRLRSFSVVGVSGLGVFAETAYYRASSIGVSPSEDQAKPQYRFTYATTKRAMQDELTIQRAVHEHESFMTHHH
jgi:hypothetical protein